MRKTGRAVTTPLLRVPEDEVHDRRGVVQAMGVVLEALADDYFDLAAELLVPLVEEGGVLQVGHDLISVAGQVNDGDLRRG